MSEGFGFEFYLRRQGLQTKNRNRFLGCNHKELESDLQDQTQLKSKSILTGHKKKKDLYSLFEKLTNRNRSQFL